MVYIYILIIKVQSLSCMIRQDSLSHLYMQRFHCTTNHDCVTAIYWLEILFAAMPAWTHIYYIIVESTEDEGSAQRSIIRFEFADVAVKSRRLYCTHCIYIYSWKLTQKMPP